MSRCCCVGKDFICSSTNIAISGKVLTLAAAILFIAVVGVVGVSGGFIMSSIISISRSRFLAVFSFVAHDLFLALTLTLLDLDELFCLAELFSA